MRILVTGALGHIGSRLIRDIALSMPGTDVHLLDNLSTQRYGSLFNLPDAGRYRFTEGDILTENLAPLVEGVDAVIHLAALTDVAEHYTTAAEIDRVNCGGTDRIARACIREGCPLIFVSTTSVYGARNGPVDEDSPIGDVRSQGPYTVSKWTSEQLLHMLGEENGLRFVICRLATIFGVSPGMRFHTAVNKFCWQAVTGRPLTVWRTALHQERPYLDLGDASTALTFILRHRLFDRRVYNMVSLNATVNTVVKTIAAHVPNVDVQYTESAIMNDVSYRVANRRFTSLGFEFTGTLDGGIRDTMRLFRALIGSTDGRPLHA